MSALFPVWEGKRVVGTITDRDISTLACVAMSKVVARCFEDQDVPAVRPIITIPA